MASKELNPLFAEQVLEILSNKHFTRETSYGVRKYLENAAIVGRAKEAILKVPHIKKRIGVKKVDGDFAFAFTFDGMLFDADYSKLETPAGTEETLMISLMARSHNESVRFINHHYKDGQISSSIVYRLGDAILSSDYDENKQEALKLIEQIEGFSQP